MRRYCKKEGCLIPKKSFADRVKALINLCFGISDVISRDRVTVYAAQSSFFVVISSVPFIMLILTLLRYITPVSEAELYSLAGEYIPTRFIPFTDSLIDEIFGGSGFSIISFSAVAILWSATKGFKSIGEGIRNIYKTDDDTGLIRNYFLSLMFTLFATIGTAVGVLSVIFGRIITDYADAYFSVSIRSTLLFKLFSLLFMPATLTLLLMAVYKGLCRHEMRFGQQFFGALFTAVGWIAFSLAYSFYIDSFANYSYIYGSLTAIILFMLWLYTCMIILLLGAEVNVFFYEKAQKKNTPLS